VLLHLDSSPQLEGSASRRLTSYLVNALTRASSGSSRVVRRDLASNPVPHLQAGTLSHIRNRGTTSADADDVRLTEELVHELLEAQTLVIGAPMYNFTVPTQLKAWLDRVVLAGRTFRYTPQGPVGLCVGKRAYIVSTRGGVYSTPDRAPWDFQEPYLRAILQFIGISEVEVVQAEGLALSSESRDASFARAEAQIDALLASASTLRR